MGGEIRDGLGHIGIEDCAQPGLRVALPRLEQST